MGCRRFLASLSATSHTIQATHSQCYTLLNSCNMARPPLLRSHLLQYRRLMLLHPQVLFPAHCYHAVHSAHKSLRLPSEMAQEVSCRSLKRSRSSHFLSSHSAAESQPPVSISLLEAAVQTTTPCDVSQEVYRTSFRVMWPFRRLSIVSRPYHWMLLRRRPHPALRLNMSPRRWVLAQLVRFLLIRLCRFLHIVLCNLTLSHNSTSLSSSLAGFSQTVLLIFGILFRQSPPSVLGAHVAPFPPPGLEQPTSSPVIATQPQSLTNVSSSLCFTLQPTASTTHVGTHPVRPAGAKRSASTAQAGNHNTNGPCPRTEVAPFPKPNAVILPMIIFGHSKTSGPQSRRHSGQRYHASSISPFTFTVESRPGAKKSYQYCFCCLWQIPCSYSPGSQRPCPARL